jgi:hypothetical protein
VKLKAENDESPRSVERIRAEKEKLLNEGIKRGVVKRVTIKKLKGRLLKTEVENKTETISLRSLNHSQKFLIGFLRGFLDSDGYADKNYKRVSMFCISRNMMRQIYQISKSFGFKPSVYVRKDKRQKRKDLHFVILTKEDAKKFINFIKPRNSKRVPKWARSHRHV